MRETRTQSRTWVATPAHRGEVQIMPTQPVTRSWWEQRTPLEKIGVVALGGAAAVVGAAILFPHAAATMAGGALASGGALLLKKGFGA